MHEPVKDGIHLKTLKKKSYSMQKLLPRKNMNIFYTLLYKKKVHASRWSPAQMFSGPCHAPPQLPSHDIQGEGNVTKP